MKKKKSFARCPETIICTIFACHLYHLHNKIKQIIKQNHPNVKHLKRFGGGEKYLLSDKCEMICESLCRLAFHILSSGFETFLDQFLGKNMLNSLILKSYEISFLSVLWNSGRRLFIGNKERQLEFVWPFPVYKVLSNASSNLILTKLL